MEQLSVPSPQQAEKYRKRVMLQQVLIKLSHVNLFNPMTEVLQFELDLVKSLCKKDGSYFNSQTLTKLERKIDHYRQHFFTSIDWVDHRAMWYIKNGLWTDLQNNTVTLQTMCLLQQESAEVIAAIGTIILCDTDFCMCPSINSTELIGFFRENAYHSNFLVYRDIDNISDQNLWSLHRISVKFGHTFIVRRIYDQLKNFPNMNFKLCLNYIVLQGELPEYVENDHDMAQRPAYLQNLYERYALECNVEKIRYMLKHKINVNYDPIMKILLCHGTFIGLFIYDMIVKTLPDVLDYMTRHIHQLKICNYPLSFDYLFNKIDKLPDRALFQRHLYREYNAYVRFNDVITIHNIVTLRGMKFDYTETIHHLLEVDKLSKLSKSGVERLLYYLNVLDDMACRNNKELNFTTIWMRLISTKNVDVYRWVLNATRDKNIKMDIGRTINEFLICNVDYTQFFDLIKEYMDVFRFNSMYGFSYNLFTVSRFLDKTSLWNFLQAVLELFVYAGKQLNFMEMFDVTENIIQSSGMQAVYFGKWLEQRILEQGNVPNYSNILDNIRLENNGYNPIKLWAQSRII